MGGGGEKIAKVSLFRENGGASHRCPLLQRLYLPWKCKNANGMDVHSLHVYKETWLVQLYLRGTSQLAQVLPLPFWEWGAGASQCFLLSASVLVFLNACLASQSMRSDETRLTGFQRSGVVGVTAPVFLGVPQDTGVHLSALQGRSVDLPSSHRLKNVFAKNGLLDQDCIMSAFRERVYCTVQSSF